MKNFMTIAFLFNSGYCFAESVTLYNEKGVSLSYQYEKIATTDSDCPNVLFDEYHVVAKVQNTNNKAIILDDSGWLVPRLAFKGDFCTKAGQLNSEVNNYFSGLFMPHRSYGTATPNTGFGAIHTYFLDATDEFVDLPATIKILKGQPLSKPEWHFPEWKFIDVPNNQNVANTVNNANQGKNAPQSTNNAENYEKLIVGKWRFSQSSSLLNGKEIEIYDEEDACYDIFETNKRTKFNVGDCNNGEENGKWKITDNILTKYFPDFDHQYEILQLNKSILKIKTTTNENTYGKYFILKFEKVTK
ncbi:hypothetical protein B9T24_13615 [Acinetobacter sp. ANC 4654]|uniref:lipocalin family protein n=1 Tax=Acinetobacter sp. ANC 4654 TaxID=1977872 RepID=UPI000A347C95|nr:lipocalin family protein [Acinetobacter sp. ANC 4654]OTG93513.1 hypothetical protein B9T24_13615 [Acinetobacter sp. ANC 4654]